MRDERMVSFANSRERSPDRSRTPRLRFRRIDRLHAFVAELPHLAEQLRQRHARERLEQSRHLRSHLGDVAGDLVHPGSIAVSGGDDRDLVDIRQRTGQCLHHFRHAGKQLVDHGRLVVLLVGLGFYVHRFGFGFAFLEDDLGFGLALRTNRGRMAFGFRDQTLLLGCRERFNSLTIDLGSLQHGRDEFLFAAIDFRLLHLDLLLFLDLLHLHRFGDRPAAA